MNEVLNRLASPNWSALMQTLGHTLWIAALAAASLYLSLRRCVDPFVRYRRSVAALGSIIVGALLSWAVLHELAGQPSAGASTQPRLTTAQTTALAVAAPAIPVMPSAASAPARFVGAGKFVPWLAMLWLGGAGLMLLRAAGLVAAAEAVRRSGEPLGPGPMSDLVETVRREFGTVRRIRTVITDRLTSPAVVGILVPTLILPLSLTTTLSMDQLRLILIHEIAHIRRSDYLVNLGQLLAEALLFFNPAVWWINRLIRQEREACCDALAVAATGGRVEYARTLAAVAAAGVSFAPAAAPAFGGRTRGGRLKDRVQRLLVPGYCPSARWSWWTLGSSMLLGGALLVASAFSVQWTLHAASALLTPKQRIERIEAVMTQLGQAPQADSHDQSDPIEASARIRLPDGARLPRSANAIFSVRTRRSSYGVTCGPDANGVFKTRLVKGDTYFGAFLEGFAPAYIGPIDTRRSNRVDNLELILQRGFAVPLQVNDSETGQPIPNAQVRAQWWIPGSSSTSFAALLLTPDTRGYTILSNCGPLAISLVLRAPGYEAFEKKINRLQPGDHIELASRHALRTEGVALDAANRQPLADARLYVLRAEGASGFAGIDPRHPNSPIATTDEHGRFVLHQLPRTGRFWLLVESPGHGQAILPEVLAGQTNLQVELGPMLPVQGRITGHLDSLQQQDNRPVITVHYLYPAGDQVNSYGELVSVQMVDGVGSFSFTNSLAGPVEVTAGTKTFRRDVRAPLNDWLLELPGPEAAPKRRDVIVQFETTSGVPPGGTVVVNLPGDKPATAERRELNIEAGQVRFACLANRDELSIEPGRTVGFWFERQPGIRIPEGDAPFVHRIQAIPAGAIYAQARNADSSPAADVLFSVLELEKAPAASEQWPRTPSGDRVSSGDGPRRYVATPLPLGGVYQVLASRGNSMALSRPVRLTEAVPDSHIELQLTTGTRLEGRILGPNGQPLPYAAIEPVVQSAPGFSHGLSQVHTDRDGVFRIDEINPDAGHYELTVHAPGLRSEHVSVDFGKLPLTVLLQPGLHASGQVLEVGSGRPVAGAEVRAMEKEFRYPNATARTDQEGRFEFTTLHDSTYRLSVDAAQLKDYSRMPEMRAGDDRPVTVEVIIPKDSRLARP